MSWVIVGSAAVGLAKSELIDKPKHEKMQAAEAEKTKWSPWTGMQGKTLTPPSSFGSMLQGASMGAMMKQAGVGGDAGGTNVISGGQTQQLATDPKSYDGPLLRSPSIYEDMNTPTGYQGASPYSFMGRQ